MGDDVTGVTICPSCNADLQPTDSDDGRPLQCLEQSCSDGCGWTTTLSLVWYPMKTYEIIGECHDDETCVDCPDEATKVVVASDTRIPIFFCSDCLGAHHRRAAGRCNDSG